MDISLFIGKFDEHEDWLISWEDWLKNAMQTIVQRNVVIFDYRAKPGELTARLYTLCRTYKSDKYSYVFVKCEHAHSLRSEIMLSNLAPITIVEYDTIYNNIKDYYLNTLQGSFPSEDNDFILFVTEDFSEFVLGSY